MFNQPVSSCSRDRATPAVPAPKHLYEHLPPFHCFPYTLLLLSIQCTPCPTAHRLPSMIYLCSWLNLCFWSKQLWWPALMANSSDSELLVVAGSHSPTLNDEWLAGGQWTTTWAVIHIFFFDIKKKICHDAFGQHSGLRNQIKEEGMPLPNQHCLFQQRVIGRGSWWLQRQSQPMRTP